MNDDLIKKYLEEKYGPDFAAKQQAAQADTANNTRWAELAANLGSTIAGSPIGQQSAYFKGLRDESKKPMEQYQADQKTLVDQYLKNKYYDSMLAMKEKELGFKSQESEKKAQEREEVRADKAAEKKSKADELTAVQAKQLGLAEMGQKANAQFEGALKKGYDPTSYSPGDYAAQIEMLPQWMKSDAGKEAMSAQASWVESYLRDASGAAIPPSERGAYAKDYFPRPGDTPDIVANKADLRKQKEQSALIGAGPGAKLFTPDQEASERQKRIAELKAKKAGK